MASSTLSNHDSSNSDASTSDDSSSASDPLDTDSEPASPIPTIDPLNPSTHSLPWTPTRPILTPTPSFSISPLTSLRPCTHPPTSQASRLTSLPTELRHTIYTFHFTPTTHRLAFALPRHTHRNHTRKCKETSRFSRSQPNSLTLIRSMIPTELLRTCQEIEREARGYVTENILSLAPELHVENPCVEVRTQMEFLADVLARMYGWQMGAHEGTRTMVVAPSVAPVEVCEEVVSRVFGSRWFERENRTRVFWWGWLAAKQMCWREEAGLEHKVVRVRGTWRGEREDREDVERKFAEARDFRGEGFGVVWV